MNSVERFHLWQSESQGQMVSELQWECIAKLTMLTGSELRVCKLLFAGFTRQEVANELGIKNRTARKYTEQLHEKLQVSNRASLVLRIIQVRDQIVGSKPSTQTPVTICINCRKVIVKSK